MSLSKLAVSELPELDEFYRALGTPMPDENLTQFSAPRSVQAGIEVVTLVLREGGRIVGTIGWLDVPLRVNDHRGMPRTEAPSSVRWPVNLYLLPEHRGKGLGRKLMEATGEGAKLRAVIGGNDASMPVLDRTGWKVIGHLSCARWVRPCLEPSRLKDRLNRAERSEPPASIVLRAGGDVVIARRVARLKGILPWSMDDACGEPEEAGVPRDARYLEHAFEGVLRRHHTLHSVTVNGAVSGFFVLASRAERLPCLTAEIVDIDAVPGREAHVIAAARRTALACADVARLRLCGDRFAGALRSLVSMRRLTQDHPLRISVGRNQEWTGACLTSAGSWRLTYGDHDQYRVRATSQLWRADLPDSGRTARAGGRVEMTTMGTIQRDENRAVGGEEHSGPDQRAGRDARG